MTIQYFGKPKMPWQDRAKLDIAVTDMLHMNAAVGLTQAELKSKLRLTLAWDLLHHMEEQLQDKQILRSLKRLQGGHVARAVPHEGTTRWYPT